MSLLLTTLLTLTGASGFFASRAFLPALLTGLAMRFGSHLPLLQDVSLIAHVGALPPWFTSDAALVGLAVLAVLESQQERIPEIAASFDLVSRHLRTALAVLTALGLLQSGDAQFLQAVSEPVAQAGWAGALTPIPLALSVFVGGLTWLAAGLRDAVVGWLRDADPDDALHLHQLFRWAESSWVGIGVVALLLAPVLVAAVLAGLFLALGLWRRQQQAAEKRQMQPCSQCQRPVLPAALACGHCQTPQPAPRTITWLGTVGQRVAKSTADQQLALLATQRCPTCAKRLPGQSMAKAQCTVCQTKPLGQAVQRQAFLNGIEQRLPWVLGILALAGLVPVLGLAVGLVLVRLRLVAPLARWLPLGRRLKTKWLLRIGFVALAALQVLPLVGAILVPLYGLLSWWMWRRAYLLAVANSSAVI